MQYRTRLLAAGAAVLVVAGLALWGLFPAGAHRQPAAPGRSDTPARAVASPRPSVPDPAAVPTGWRLTFDARFSGSALNTSVWATCYPWMDLTAGCTNFGNREYQWFVPSQDRVSGGALHLVAQQIPTAGRTASGGPAEYSCRSGMVTSYPGFRFKYGYLQVVARLPSAAGMWSALWLAAANLRWPPEIDLLEHWGKHTGLYFHPLGAVQIGSHPATADLSAGWHTFGLRWTPGQLVWFIDGRTVMSVRHRVPDQVMYFVADLAEYKPPGTVGPCTGTLLIRSVRVWQR